MEGRLGAFGAQLAGLSATNHPTGSVAVGGDGVQQQQQQVGSWRLWQSNALTHTKLRTHKCPTRGSVMICRFGLSAREASAN